MTVLIGQDIGGKVSTPYYKRKIQCPGHYLIPPRVDIYLRELVPELKDCSNWVEYKGAQMHIKKHRIARDRYGQKRIDWKKLYDLKRKGIVIQPWISSSYAIENVYDPEGTLCKMCDKRCMEGKGKIATQTIGRLMRGVH